MLQLLIALCLNFLTKQQLTSQRPGRQSQLGSWSWNETHLKVHMTLIIDINLHPMEASSKVDHFTAGYVQSHRRCNVIYFLSCSYLEQLIDYRYIYSCATVVSVVKFNVLYFLSECWMQPSGWLNFRSTSF